MVDCKLEECLHQSWGAILNGGKQSLATCVREFSADADEYIDNHKSLKNGRRSV